MFAAVRSMQELLIEKERYFAQVQERSNFFCHCEKGCLKKIKKYLKSDPELIDIKNEENLTVLEVLITNRHHAVLEHLLLWNPVKISSLIKEKPAIFFLAIESGLVNLVETLTSLDKDLLKIKNEEEENLFFSACKSFNLRLMKHFHALSPGLIKTKNLKKETPFSFLACSKDEGSSCFIWFLKHTTYQISSSEEALAFYENMRSNFFFEEALILKVLNLNTLSYFLPLIKGFERAVKSDRVLQHIQDLLDPYPNNFFYEPQGEEVFEGEDLIRFCTTQIPDVLSVGNPFQALHRLFFCIKKADYVAQMTFGSTKVSTKAVKEQKKQDLQECRSLFHKIKNETHFRKTYLVRILKHLSCHLKTAEGSKEKIMFLKDLTAAAPHCYTHYSTILRSIYSRISQDEVFSSAQVRSDSEASMFENSLRLFMKQAFCKKLREIHGSMNVHCQYLVQKFLKEENYPLAEAPILDEEQHLMPTLMLFRQEKLEILFEDEDESIVDDDLVLYEDTKRLYFDLLEENLLNLDFLYNNTLQFLMEKLSEENPGLFLSHLTEWLQQKNIGIHSLLKYSDSGEYRIKRSGILAILSKFPKKFNL